MKAKMAMAAALATLVTVGGVYATWTFSEGNVTNASTTVNVAMTGVNATTEKGTLSVMVKHTNGFTLALDDANNDHYAELKKTGNVLITFTPSATASQAVKDDGIDVQLAISYTAHTGGPASLEEWKYEDTQIFKILNDASAPIHLDNEDAVKGTDGVFTWTVDAADVGITLTDEIDDVLIDTLAKYNALGEVLAKGYFTLTVSECTTASHNL